MDEVQRLLLQVEGEEKLKSLNKQLADEREFLLQLKQIQAQGVVGVSPATIEQAAAHMVQLNQQIKELERGTKGLTSPQALLNLSYIFDDLANTSGNWDRKLASISNNIPGLVASLGLGGAGSRARSVYSERRSSRSRRSRKRHGTRYGIRAGETAERLKTIADRAEAAAKAFDKMVEAKTKSEQKASGGLAELLKEKGPEEIRRGIIESMIATGTGAKLDQGEDQPTMWETQYAQWSGGDEFKIARERARKAPREVEHRQGEPNPRRRAARRRRSRPSGSGRARVLVAQERGRVPDRFRGRHYAHLPGIGQGASGDRRDEPTRRDRDERDDETRGGGGNRARAAAARNRASGRER